MRFDKLTFCFLERQPLQAPLILEGISDEELRLKVGSVLRASTERTLVPKMQLSNQRDCISASRCPFNVASPVLCQMWIHLPARCVLIVRQVPLVALILAVFGCCARQAAGISD